jgi:hypothetical protein
MMLLAHKLYYILLMLMLTVCVLCFHLICYHSLLVLVHRINFTFIYEQETYDVYALIHIIMLHTFSIKDY